MSQTSKSVEYETTEISSIEQLKKEIVDLTKNHPGKPFLFHTVFGATYVTFYDKPSSIPIDTMETRSFKREHGFQGYYLNSIENPVKQGQGWVNKQISYDNKTGAE